MKPLLSVMLVSPTFAPWVYVKAMLCLLPCLFLPGAGEGRGGAFGGALARAKGSLWL